MLVSLPRCTNYNIIFPFTMAGCGADIHVIVKIESADSIPNLHSIITASDGVISLILAFYLLVAAPFDGQLSFRPRIPPVFFNIDLNLASYLSIKKIKKSRFLLVLCTTWHLLQHMLFLFQAMVAREDLGVELPIEEVPLLQVFYF